MAWSESSTHLLGQNFALSGKEQSAASHKAARSEQVWGHFSIAKFWAQSTTKHSSGSALN